MKYIKYSLFPLFLVLFLAASCKKEKDPLNIPAQYDGAAWQLNTTQQYGVRARLDALVMEIKKGRTTGVVLDYATLSQLYNTGAPSLKSLTTSYYAGRLDGAGNWLDELAKAGGSVYTPGVPAGQGGTFGGFLFDENGLEFEQLVEKGLFGAALYHHAVTLMQGDITSENTDQILAVFGAHPDFPNTPTAANAANPDKYLANYAARRDKNDGKGLYSQIKTNFITAQAAIKAGSDYNTERDEALSALRLNWEKVNFATVVNYCHSVISRMSATNP